MRDLPLALERCSSRAIPALAGLPGLGSSCLLIIRHRPAGARCQEAASASDIGRGAVVTGNFAAMIRCFYRLPTDCYSVGTPSAIKTRDGRPSPPSLHAFRRNYALNPRRHTGLPGVIWWLCKFPSSSALIKTRNLRSENVLSSTNPRRFVFDANELHMIPTSQRSADHHQEIWCEISQHRRLFRQKISN
jgi:hypothetical protein